MIDELSTVDDDEAALRDLVREVAEREIAPKLAYADEHEEYPGEILPTLADLGFFGGLVPVEYGGLGLSHHAYSVLIEEMAKVDHITAVLISMPSSLVGAGLRLYGTEAQKQRWLVPLAQGRLFGAGGVTEPRSGSDVAGMTTTYRKTGDGFVINGSKAWISNLDRADIIVTFATLDRTLGSRGISAFVIPTDTPGLSFQPYKNKLGFRHIVTGDVFLDDVFVPEENLLGDEGHGFAVAMSAVESGRLAVASRAVGVAQACLDASVAYALEREVFGHRIADYQLIKAKVADMATGVVTARLLTRAAARLMDRGDRARAPLSMAKMYASDVLQRAATEAVQVHGAYGTSAEYAVSKHYRDAKVFQIIEGTNEIHRLLVADYVLGVRK